MHSGSRALPERSVAEAGEVCAVGNVRHIGAELRGAEYAPGRGQLLRSAGNDAFGNFRPLLKDVTLNPMMGQFLSMLGNDKGNATTDPDENYAREVMQLFTVGLYKLNDDGIAATGLDRRADTDLFEHGCDGAGQSLHRFRLEYTGRR